MLVKRFKVLFFLMFLFPLRSVSFSLLSKKRIRIRSTLFLSSAGQIGPNVSRPLTYNTVSSHIGIHVIVGTDSPTVESSITSNLARQWKESDSIPTFFSEEQLSPRNLLQLGSVWFLSASAAAKNSGQKPQRLSLDDSTRELQENDYLRIHCNPRRFLEVYNYNFTAWKDERENGIIVGKGEGFWIIDKPAKVPVHPTSDNYVENVQEQIKKAVGNYVSTPQRLDQNTSGIFVVARSKSFAGYFAELLRTKTKVLLETDNSTKVRKVESIQKGYKCLLCLIPNNSSMAESYQNLKSYDVLTHYLEPSIRAPKKFSRTQENSKWLESRLRVASVGKVFPLIGSKAAEGLQSKLWGSAKLPDGCIGVTEVTVELLTGRTHQIRGQFAAEGYPLVGDTQYGGAIPVDIKNAEIQEEYSKNSERLALQCSYLKFLDPDVVVKENGDEDLKPSNRWNEYKLNHSWWDALLQNYRDDTNNEATTSLKDIQGASLLKSRTQANIKVKRELLPPRVALSPGANKYVLVKAKDPDNGVLWFVKSAQASECGGPYHANVANDLVEWLEACDLEVEITGGGRIDYNPEKKYANVYGFSYGFGKGNHAKAAALIEKNSDILATFDNS
eukprot:CAMPEP_0194254570 /NCGR_PEP_ID=MMETSP0158-20130606/32442_1 /TAXON_ID=33649 /ORGANISM="Thalassionema nitzschioides, Strain L26-B" /LENGTH=614 /DNA_ID=CAMNT_0038992645 /DNA_START=88 /DNA_END=1928 /DNA_ORIENTATION=-